MTQKLLIEGLSPLEHIVALANGRTMGTGDPQREINRAMVRFDAWVVNGLPSPLGRGKKRRLEQTGPSGE